ncbi:hypothetical protein T05_6819 [Trichinella murrelli]|uniref:Uncharacterized protein n=1 Tax=Trichinella murrelli TaxID=144512 RepID=A0A0V0TTU7_9BILA|nr:hypothetical protein T05_6819 [Trichinella murrelli]
MQLITSILLSSIYPQLVVVDSEDLFIDERCKRVVSFVIAIPDFEGYCVSIHALLFDLPNLSTKLDTINHYLKVNNESICMLCVVAVTDFQPTGMILMRAKACHQWGEQRFC